MDLQVKYMIFPEIMISEERQDTTCSPHALDRLVVCAISHKVWDSNKCKLVPLDLAL